MAHSVIGRMYSSLGSVAEVSSIHPLSTLLLMRADVCSCAHLASGWAGSLEWPGRRAGDRREGGGEGGKSRACTHGSLPVKPLSPE